MKLIDVTVYYGKWPHWPIKITTPDALVGEMDRWKIDQAVVASTKSVFLNCEDGHPHLDDLVQKYPKTFHWIPDRQPEGGREITGPGGRSP